MMEAEIFCFGTAWKLTVSKAPSTLAASPFINSSHNFWMSKIQEHQNEPSYNSAPRYENQSLELNICLFETCEAASLGRNRPVEMLCWLLDQEEKKAILTVEQQRQETSWISKLGSLPSLSCSIVTTDL